MRFWASAARIFSPPSRMAHVPGLRSPYAKVGRLVYFGRMVDKIRLHAAGRLPVADYTPNMGKAFDARCCTFLRVNYDELRARALIGDLSDLPLLTWAEQHGGARTDEECDVWNGFMAKRGWRDEVAEVLARRIAESRLEGRPVLTMFDYLDFDEGRFSTHSRPWELRDPVVVLLMGVAGSGKTTVGTHLAAELGWSFRDADDFHPPENIAKMGAGTPLTDDDRAPWLAAIRHHIAGTLARGESGVVTCSALRERYRTAATPSTGRVRLVHLTGNFELIHGRMQARTDHFMKPEMLQSQFAALEQPADALSLDVTRSPADLVGEIRRDLAL